MTEENFGSSPAGVRLNEYQARHLCVTCQYVDKLLGDLEQVLDASASKAAFPRYSADIAPVQNRTIRDYVARVRARLVHVLDGQGIRRDRPLIPASRAAHVTLGAIDNAMEELKPQYMRGYGDVPDSAARELNGVVSELRGWVSKLDRYLSERIEEDFKARLQRLERQGHNLQLLSVIERVIAECGLVEFRGSVAAILERIEEKTFEIAVLGRVSSGKSSLLNAILERSVLPVGVTPVTAVPTRIAHAEKASMTVCFAEAPTKILDVSSLPEFATEQLNPGNAKCVTRITVTLPAPRLRDGVTFMDTPGVGSLATTGGSATLAYLPQCDLGIVLIDAGSTLAADDLETILMLQQAAIPMNVLLSKTDLLTAEDCEKVLRYVAMHLASELKLEVPVHPVSSLSSHRKLLDRWLEEQILPLYARSEELRAASLSRKIGALCESVVTTLEVSLQGSEAQASGIDSQVRAAEARLRHVAGLIEETDSKWETELERLPIATFDILLAAAASLIDEWYRQGDRAVSAGKSVSSFVVQVVRGRIKELHDQMEALAVDLAHQLRRSAADLGVRDVPSDEEFQSVVRGMPAFDPGSLNLSVSRPTLARLFGRRVATKQLARRLSRELGVALQQSLATYSAVVKEWMKVVTDQLRRRFDTYAEGYRAHAERRAGRTRVTDEQARNLRESLGILRDAQFRGGVADTSKQEAADVRRPLSEEVVQHVHKGESHQST
jgi:GTP-binding protein EngB required for normal cell division